MQAALRTLQPRTKLRVDRAGAGKIMGASLATKGPAIGHGFQLDDESIDQIAALAAKSEPAGWWTHCTGADGLGMHLGRWTAARREGDKVIADFEISATAKHVRPEGLSVDAATYLLDLAEQDPEAFGVSPFIGFTLEEQKGRLPAARVLSVQRADFTAYPAANPSGLLSARPEEGTTMDIETLKTENAALAAQRDAQAAKVAALEAGLKAAEDREAARRAKEIAAKVAALQAQALPNAISEADLGHVRACLERGDDALADRIGKLLVGSTRELAAVTPASGGLPVGSSASTDRAKSETAYQAAQLRAAGWSVDVSSDGTQITSKTPPRAAGK